MANIKLDLVSLKPDPLVLTIFSFENAISSASFIKLTFSSLVKCFSSNKSKFFSPIKCRSLSGRELYSSSGVTLVELIHLLIRSIRLFSFRFVEDIEAFFFAI